MEARYPYDLSLEQVLVEHRRTYSNPRVRFVSDTIITEGPRRSKVATMFQIINEHTGEIHHYSLKLQTVTRRSGSGYQFSEERSITIGGPEEGANEIGKLMTFIASVTHGLLPAEDGRYVIIESKKRATTELLKLLQGVEAPEKLRFALHVLSELGQDSVEPKELETILEDQDVTLVRGIAIISRLVEYRRAHKELKKMVEQPDTRESQIQRHLENNPWMFGSEYSELLNRRVWTRDDQQDFMLRRTADGYLEIVEIKTPFREALFYHDGSHGSYYQSARLSQAIGQVMKYIEQVDRDRDRIVAHDREDPLKIQARIIIGRDCNEEQQAALLNLNAHLNRIEVLTFDQLLRISDRVLDIFEEQRQEASREFDDLPF